MQKARWIGIIMLSLLVATLPVDAANQVSLVEALSAAQNTVGVIEAQNALQKAEDALIDLSEAQRFNWQVQSPVFSVGDQGFTELDAWSLSGTRGGVDTITTRAYQDDLSITWTRSLSPDPVPAEQLKVESLHISRRAAADNLAAGYYQSLINTYESYRSAQLDLIGLQLNRQQAAQAKAEYERVLALAELGETTPIAVTQAKSAWLKLETQVKQREVTDANKINLFLVGLGFAPGTQLEPLELEVLLEQARAEVERPVPSGIPVEQFLSQNREVIALREQVRLKELALRTVKAKSAWNVQVSADASMDLVNQEPHWKVSLGAITYDLSGGAAKARDLARAEQDLELARRQLREAEYRIAQDYQVTLTALTLQHSLLELAVWELDAVRSDYELARRQYAAGIITDRGLEKAKLSYEEAKLSLAEALLNYEVQKYTVLAMQGEKPLLALVEGESIDER